MATSAIRAAVHKTANGITLRVRVTPKASRDRIGAIVETPEGPAVRASVRAQPSDAADGRAKAMTFHTSARRTG